MRTTTFLLSQHEAEQTDPPFNVWRMIYFVPTLPAYSIEYAEMRVSSGIDGVSPTTLILERDFSINGKRVVREGVSDSFLANEIPLLIIHYHGIREFSGLFPAVSNDQADRLGRYYSEAESAFESGAWLSFSLMCGAIAEGLLMCSLQKRNWAFEGLIDEAEKSSIITSDEAGILRRVKEFRNLIHMRRCDEPYVERKDAMDMRKVIDDVIKKFSQL
jgi:hypothetical protein